MEGFSSNSLGRFYRTYVLEVRDLKEEGTEIEISSNSLATPTREMAEAADQYFAAGQDTLQASLTVGTLPSNWLVAGPHYIFQIRKEGAARYPDQRGVVLKQDRTLLRDLMAPFKVKEEWKDGLVQVASVELGRKVYKKGDAVPDGRYQVEWVFTCAQDLALTVLGPVVTVGKIELEALDVKPTIFDPTKGPCVIKTKVWGVPATSSKPLPTPLRIWLEVLKTRTGLDDSPLESPTNNPARVVWHKALFDKKSVLQSPLGLRFEWDGSATFTATDLTTTPPTNPLIERAPNLGPVPMAAYTIIVTGQVEDTDENLKPHKREKISVRARIVKAKVSFPTFTATSPTSQKPLLYAPEHGSLDFSLTIDTGEITDTFAFDSATTLEGIVRITSANGGKLVRELTTTKLAPGRSNPMSLSWDGLDTAGHELPRGAYRATAGVRFIIATGVGTGQQDERKTDAMWNEDSIDFKLNPYTSAVIHYNPTNLYDLNNVCGINVTASRIGELLEARVHQVPGFDKFVVVTRQEVNLENIPLQEGNVWHSRLQFYHGRWLTPPPGQPVPEYGPYGNTDNPHHFSQVSIPEVDLTLRADIQEDMRADQMPAALLSTYLENAVYNTITHELIHAFDTQPHATAEFYNANGVDVWHRLMCYNASHTFPYYYLVPLWLDSVVAIPALSRRLIDG